LYEYDLTSKKYQSIFFTSDPSITAITAMALTHKAVWLATNAGLFVQPHRKKSKLCNLPTPTQNILNVATGNSKLFGHTV
jgi:hypothetical protein